MPIHKSRVTELHVSLKHLNSALGIFPLPRMMMLSLHQLDRDGTIIYLEHFLVPTAEHLLH